MNNNKLINFFYKNFLLAYFYQNYCLILMRPIGRRSRKKRAYFPLKSLFVFSIIVLFFSTGFSQSRDQVNFKSKVDKSDSPFVDHSNGAITDTRTGLMWTKMDSHSDTGKCLNWNESKVYVNTLSTGGFKDWRIPKEEELRSIYDPSKWNKMGFDQNYPLHLDKIFAEGAAYWYWLPEIAGSCCAGAFNFIDGTANTLNRERCINLGVRAVRS